MKHKLNKIIINIIYYIRKQHVNICMNELANTENITHDELFNYKMQKIREQIRCVSNNSYYRNTFRDDNHNSQLMDVSNNFSKLPITTKEFYKKNLHAFLDENIKYDWRSTSGTTGTPFVFPKDRIAACYMDAMMYNAYSWHGIEIGDKQARLWGRAVKTKERLIQSVKDFIMNRKRLSAFEMNDDSCLKYFQKLIRFKPRYFYAYSNALYQFAICLEKNKLNGKLLGVDIAICTGEVLFPHQRMKIAEVFGCKVVNEYGSTENGILGFECEYGKMHVMPTVMLEIDNPDENGLGHLVVTELNSRSIPFVRYRNGDIGKLVKETCECKRPYEIIEIHEGRIDDYIRCPDGRLVYDAILAYTLKEYAIQFKAYQEIADRIKIYVVPSEKYNTHTEAKIKKTLQKYLGEEMRVDIFQAEKISHEMSGKFRYFVSSLNS